ncbi:MAG: ArsC family reductase [Sphingomonas sp. 28-66-16]|nr:MAG: ArsC family reductase [Sphingomonas sp. 28-66-16]
MTTIYGIRNCDTMKKARAALDAAGIAHDFHDYKASGVDPVRLQGWIERLGWEKLLNRAGTTFRKLDDSAKVDLDEARAVALMLAHPSAIKRPVLEHGDRLILGYDPDIYRNLGG